MKRSISVILALVFFITTYAQSTIYTNDMDFVLGDVKQAFIQNKITTQEQAQNLIKGLKNLGVNGIRVPIFAQGLDPNKPMFDYFFNLAVAEGFPVFANPAQSSGGQRIACGILNGDLSPVKDDSEKTNVLINRIKAFAAEYPCKWINPFNEDGAPDGAWSASQMDLIFSSLKGNVNGAELIGPCVWGIPASINVFKNTTVANDITIATTHNLGFNHEDWAEFMALAKAKDMPVWDSEVNHTDKYNTGTRLEVALASGVDGLVMYNIWNTVDLSNGAISNGGKELMSLYLKSMPELTPNYQVDEGAWIQSSTALANAGSTLKLAPLPNDGAWRWSGPNGFSATTREITLAGMASQHSGKYVASYTSPEGEVNHLVMTVGLSCSPSPSITPYYQIDGVSWIGGSSVNIDEGSSLKLGPSSSSVVTWAWMGPDGYTSNSREITVSDILVSEEGQYRVTGIDGSGCGTIVDYSVAVNDVEVPFPDPDARYYIDCPTWGVRLGANGGQDAFTTSTSVTDYSVQWTVKESSAAGYYFIDCIGAVANPRIRTDQTAYADMDSRSSTGSWARWSLTQGPGNTFYLTTEDSFLPRLQINSSGEARMVAATTVDNTVQFTFTNIDKGLVGTTPTSIYQPAETSEFIFPGIINSPGMQLKPINYVENISTYRLDVYDIQGKHLFTSYQMDNGWSPNGHERGIYIYTLNYAGADNQLNRISGKCYCDVY